MKIFTKPEIDDGRQWHIDGKHEQCSVTHNGTEYPYFVIPEEKCPDDLPDAVQRFTGESPEDGTVFAVSASVRENVRKYPILHEIIEFIDIGIETKGRCAEASRREIELVKRDPELTPDEVRDYIDMRRNFFDNLIAFVTGTGSFTPEDIEEFRASLQVFAEEELML